MLKEESIERFTSNRAEALRTYNEPVLKYDILTATLECNWEKKL